MDGKYTCNGGGGVCSVESWGGRRFRHKSGKASLPFDNQSIYQLTRSFTLFIVVKRFNISQFSLSYVMIVRKNVVGHEGLL